MRFLRHIAITNLTVYLIVISGAVSAYAIQFHAGFGTLGPNVLEGEWWNLLAFPFKVADQWLWLFFYLYAFWLFGGALEQHLGDERYTAYIGLGILCEILGALIILLMPIPNVYALASISSVYLYLSIFFGAAYIAPNYEILLFFIIPIKLKWLALIGAGWMAVTVAQAAVFSNSMWPFLGPVLGLVNFFVFFGSGLWTNIFGPSHRRKSNFRAIVSTPRTPAGKTMHRCTVCGITEHDDAHIEFRYCVKCTDHEYCANHLASHEHIKT